MQTWLSQPESANTRVAKAELKTDEAELPETVLTSMDCREEV